MQAVAELPEAALHRGLAHLQAGEFLYETVLFPEHAYTFKHALVRDAAYESLLKTQRQQLHARIARALEEHFPETAEAEPELLARHCAEAGLAEQAVDYRRRAGEHALARSAMAEAAAQLTKGLELL